MDVYEYTYTAKRPGSDESVYVTVLGSAQETARSLAQYLLGQEYEDHVLRLTSIEPPRKY